MATQAEVRDLIAKIRATGFKVAKSGSKHYKVLSPAGAIVRDENGPLIISSSPSDNRFREMTVKRLMAAKVFKTDPYKETRGDKATGDLTHGGDANGNGGQRTKGKRGGDGAHLRTEEMQQKKLAGIKRKSDANKERTGKIRARFEPIAMKLGGWAQGRGNHLTGLAATEVGEVIFHWASTRGRMELPKRVHNQPAKLIDATHVVQSVQRLKTPAETMGERWTPLFEVFIDELERGAGTPPDPQKAAYRYQELLREAKGISPGPQSPAALPPLRSHENGSGGQEQATAAVEKLGPAFEIKAPSLALRAMWLMAKGSGDSESDALSIASDIAELELKRQKEEHGWA